MASSTNAPSLTWRRRIHEWVVFDHDIPCGKYNKHTNEQIKPPLQALSSSNKMHKNHLAQALVAPPPNIEPHIQGHLTCNILDTFDDHTTYVDLNVADNEGLVHLPQVALS